VDWNGNLRTTDDPAAAMLATSTSRSLRRCHEQGWRGGPRATLYKTEADVAKAGITAKLVPGSHLGGAGKKAFENAAFYAKKVLLFCRLEALACSHDHSVDDAPNAWCGPNDMKGLQRFLRHAKLAALKTRRGPRLSRSRRKRPKNLAKAYGCITPGRRRRDFFGVPL